MFEFDHTATLAAGLVALIVLIVAAGSVLIRTYFDHRWRHHQRVLNDINNKVEESRDDGQ